MITGIEEIFAAFKRLKRVDFTSSAIAFENSYEEAVSLVDAIDTGDFIQSIETVENSLTETAQSFIISTSGNKEVNYGDIIERGAEYSNGRKVAGRFPAKIGIENVDLEAPLTDSMDWVFGKF